MGNRLGDVGVTSTETGTSRSERLSPRNWPLVWKLVAVGLIPALLAIVLGVLRVADQAHTASQLGAANRLLEGPRPGRGRGHGPARRARPGHHVPRRGAPGRRGPLQQAVRDTDAAVERFRSGIPAPTDIDQATRTAFEQAQGGFAQLSVLRAEVDGTALLLTDDMMQSYTGVIARTDALDRALLRQVRIPDVGGLGRRADRGDRSGGGDGAPAHRSRHGTARGDGRARPTGRP